MNGRRNLVRSGLIAGGWSLLAAALVGGRARASLVKPNGSPPFDMPNTLALEMRRPEATRSVSTVEAARGARCAAAAIRLRRTGTRIVTARHCAVDVLEVFDEHHRVVPAGRSFPSKLVDLAILEVDGDLPWPGLEPRPSATLEPGERLCAWQFERGTEGFERQRICGRFVRLNARPSAPPLIELSHPYPPGTSGSALVDQQGRIAGIVVATTSESGLAEPIDPLLQWDEHSVSLTARAGRRNSALPTTTPHQVPGAVAAGRDRTVLPASVPESSHR